MKNENIENIAKNIYNFWKNNCFDEDFYNNCMESICQEINHTNGPIPDKAYKIWNIIESKYL